MTSEIITNYPEISYECVFQHCSTCVWHNPVPYINLGIFNLRTHICLTGYSSGACYCHPGSGRSDISGGVLAVAWIPQVSEVSEFVWMNIPRGNGRQVTYCSAYITSSTGCRSGSRGWTVINCDPLPERSLFTLYLFSVISHSVNR